ncbi:SCO4225 family membrane protein [Streptomyces sp. NPDC086080]|uniref:SCO4225 family membrane protein n=1 Tax=Streptomyces sp. NPDC086080 TaxID=3365748 RepID=UPI0037CCE547
MTSTPEKPTAVPEPGRSFGRRVWYVLGDIAALAYLGLIAALVIWVLVDSTVEHEDASFAGVVPLLATFPGSFLVLVLPEHPAMFFLAIAFAALVNAAIIGWCSRRLRGGGRVAS